MEDPRRRLAELERHHRELASQIADLGWTMHGSLALRHTRCGTQGCRCHADPPRLHGPYWQWTAKTHGKTTTRNLTPEQAARYQEWINNDRRLNALTTQIRANAAEARQILNQTKV